MMDVDTDRRTVWLDRSSRVTLPSAIVYTGGLLSIPPQPSYPHSDNPSDLLPAGELGQNRLSSPLGNVQQSVGWTRLIFIACTFSRVLRPDYRFFKFYTTNWKRKYMCSFLRVAFSTLVSKTNSVFLFLFFLLLRSSFAGYESCLPLA